MSTSDSFSWGAETLDRAGRGHRRTLGASRRTSLLAARAMAVIVDGFVMIGPLVGIVYALSRLFPDRGFSLSTNASSTVGLRVGASAALVGSALALSYFFLCEALRGQTVGKRRMGLRVLAAKGGPAGLNAISARTVLRLIDGLVFYLVGAAIAICTGRRRRRLGDWAGGTVVLRDDGAPVQGTPAQPIWRVLAYPASWVVAVFVVIFALGLGTAAGADEQAVSLVRSYEQARERGDGALACSMLTAEQRLELVAARTRGLPRAEPGACASVILGSDEHSHLLNPALPDFVAGGMYARYSRLGMAVVRSRGVAGLALLVVFEGGRARLDMRGLERFAFVRGCKSTPAVIGVAARAVTPARCACAFAALRADGRLAALERGQVSAAMGDAERRCFGAVPG